MAGGFLWRKIIRVLSLAISFQDIKMSKNNNNEFTYLKVILITLRPSLETYKLHIQHDKILRNKSKQTVMKGNRRNTSH